MYLIIILLKNCRWNQRLQRLLFHWQNFIKTSFISNNFFYKITKRWKPLKPTLTPPFHLPSPTPKLSRLNARAIGLMSSSPPLPNLSFHLNAELWTPRPIFRIQNISLKVMASQNSATPKRGRKKIAENSRKIESDPAVFSQDLVSLHKSEVFPSRHIYIISGCTFCIDCAFKLDKSLQFMFECNVSNDFPWIIAIFNTLITAGVLSAEGVFVSALIITASGKLDVYKMRLWANGKSLIIRDLNRISILI